MQGVMWGGRIDESNKQGRGDGQCSQIQPKSKELFHLNSFRVLQVMMTT